MNGDEIAGVVTDRGEVKVAAGDQGGQFKRIFLARNMDPILGRKPALSAI